jgi:glycosyltransferase involved in cell wall biosynthesis
MVTNSVYSRDVRVKRYAEYLADDGHLVDVVCLSNEDGHSQDGHPRVTAYPISLTRSRREGLGLVLNWASLWAMMFAKVSRLDRAGPYDCIHVHNMPDFLAFCALRPRLRRCPVLLNIHDPTPELARSKLGLPQTHPIVRAQILMERVSVAFSTHVITATPAFQRALAQRGIPPEKITVIANAADPRYFDGRIFHRDRKHPGEKFNLLYVGTVAKRYGVDICIRALPRLKAVIPGVNLRIVRKIRDEGEALQECLSLAHDLGVSDSIHVDGPVEIETMASIMAGADLGIYPALRDVHMDVALSLKIPEMAMVGLPIIASRLTVLEDLFGEDSIAFAPPGDPQAFADKIIELYRSPALRERLSANAARRSTNLSWDVQYEQYRRLLRKVLGKPINKNREQEEGLVKAF